MSTAVHCWQLVMQICLHKRAACLYPFSDFATWRTGAPIRFNDTDTPVLQGYAQYPCLHYPSVHDFTTGCPSNLKNASHFPNLKFPTQYNDSRPPTWCWVEGALKVLPKRQVCAIGMLDCITLMHKTRRSGMNARNL